MIIPIAHEQHEVNRWPWITLALIAANVLVFLWTNPLVERQEAQIRTQLQAALKYAAEHPYLRQPPEFRDLIPSRAPQADLASSSITSQQEQLNALMRDYRRATQRTVFRAYGYVPSEPSVLGLFASMFLHAGWMHLIGNMLFLWLAGTALEDRWGRLCYPALYLIGGVLATLAHATFTERPNVPLVGASGAIAALMGAFLIRFATTRIRFLYWFVVIRGTFTMPAYVALPLWVADQVWMIYTNAAGPVAVGAHIGGFAFGVLAAVAIRYSGMETKFLAPAIQQKTTWSATEAVTAALEKLDKGDLFGGIQELVEFLKLQPNNVDARAALVGAYVKKGDPAAAARESARLVSAYVVSRDFEGALAAWAEHRRVYAETPIAMRSYLALAAEHEKQTRFADAMDLYRLAFTAWPQDDLCPKAMVSCARLMLEQLHDAGAAVDVLERAGVHPKMTGEFRKASDALLEAARRSVLGAPALPPTTLTEPPLPAMAWTTMTEPPMPTLAVSPTPSPPSPPAPAPMDSMLSVESTLSLDEIEASPPVEAPRRAPEIPVRPSPPEPAIPAAMPPHPAHPAAVAPAVRPAPPPAPAPQPDLPMAPAPPAPPKKSAAERWSAELATTMVVTPGPRLKRPDPEAAAMPPPVPEPPAPAPVVPEPPPQPAKTLGAVPVKATGMDTTGLRVLDRKGRAGHLPWKQITAVSVARIEDPTDDQPAEVILDLVLAVKSDLGTDVIPTLRLTPRDIAVPQIPPESGLRGFQQFVATILKASSAKPYPTAEECLAVKGFAVYSNLAAYTAALVARLSEPR